MSETLKLTAARTPDEILEAAARWAYDNDGHEGNCPQDRIPTLDALAKWLPESPETAWRKFSEKAGKIEGGIPASAHDIALAFPGLPALLRVGQLAASGEFARYHQDSTEWERVAKWDEAKWDEAKWARFGRPPLLDAVEVIGPAIKSLHRLWIETALDPRPEHPLVPLVKACGKWKALKGKPASKVSVSASGGMVRRARQASRIVHTPWNQVPVDAVRVDGEPMAVVSPTPPQSVKQGRRVYKPSRGKLFPPGVNRLEPDWVLMATSDLLTIKHKSALAGDTDLLRSIAYASNGRLELSDLAGAALLARTRTGEFRRPQPSDVRRWHDATLGLRWAVLRDPVTHKWFPLVDVTALENSTVLAPPEWARAERFKESGGFTLTTEGGQYSRARLAASSEGSPAGRIITALEYRLAAKYSGEKGIARDLRPASGKSGPGQLVMVTWREMMTLAGYQWDGKDKKADRAMYKRYRRAVERLFVAGYQAPSPRSEAQAGDSVEIIDVRRGGNGRTAGVIVRASSRFVEAAKQATKKKAAGFEETLLSEFMGGLPEWLK